MFKNDQNNHNGNSDRNVDTVRPLPSSPQGQILTALDLLGEKLVRSETERGTMRQLLDEALSAQERLENQLERSQIDLQQRLSDLDNFDKINEATRTRFEKQDQAIAVNKADVEAQNLRQTRVEDQLRDSQQIIDNLQRRIDTQEQKRARLQRRIERVETIALEARKSLEAKAVVLLTDRTHAVTSQLPYIDATMPMQAIEKLHQDNDTAMTDVLSRHEYRPWLGKVAVGMLVAVALGLGFVGGQNFHGNDIQNSLFSRTVTQTEMAQQTQTGATEGNLNAKSTLLAFETVIEQEIAVQSGADPTLPVYDIDYDEALPMMIRLVEDKAFEGVAEAQHDLAALYASGQGDVTQNYARAAYWFRQSALQGIANAAYNLGVLYHQGLGLEQDMEKAVDCYSLAAQRGHPEAQYNLGVAYIEETGATYNPKLAAAFFRQAALGGIAEAAYNLGLILENGLLGEVRSADALFWYRGAAKKGSMEAEAALRNLSDNLDMSSGMAGILDNGDDLSAYMIHPDELEPAAGENDLLVSERYVPQDVDLNHLIPNRQQVMVAQIQGQLARIHYYGGVQNGLVNDETIAAIESYQILKKLPINGLPSEDLLSHMLSQGML